MVNNEVSTLSMNQTRHQDSSSLVNHSDAYLPFIPHLTLNPWKSVWYVSILYRKRRVSEAGFLGLKCISIISYDSVPSANHLWPGTRWNKGGHTLIPIVSSHPVILVMSPISLHSKVLFAEEKQSSEPKSIINGQCPSDGNSSKWFGKFHLCRQAIRTIVP